MHNPNGGVADVATSSINKNLFDRVLFQIYHMPRHPPDSLGPDKTGLSSMLTCYLPPDLLSLEYIPLAQFLPNCVILA